MEVGLGKEMPVIGSMQNEPLGGPGWHVRAYDRVAELDAQSASSFTTWARPFNTGGSTGSLGRRPVTYSTLIGSDRFPNGS